MHSPCARTLAGSLGLFTLLLCPAANAAGGGAATAPPPDSAREFRAGANLALQGDMPAALAHLRNARPGDLDPEKARTSACIVERFAQSLAPAKAPDLDAWSAAVLAAYRAYWQRGLLHADQRAAAESELLRALTALIERDAKGGLAAKPATLDDLEPILKARLQAHGQHALLGQTPPLRELMLWRTEEDRTYDVDLPGGPEHVQVEMLDGFSSLGWAGYATCDYYHSAGWTETDRLYCVRPSYDLDSESFRVSYLAHEGQHFADKRRFPALAAPELEYRAKLVEIARAETTLPQLLQAFTANVSDDRGQPHAFANARLLRELGAAVLHGQAPSEAAWKTVDTAALHAAALRLLADDTRRLAAAKASAATKR